MNDSSPPPAFSLSRVLLLALPLAIALYVANKLYSGKVQQEAQNDLERTTVSRLLAGAGGDKLAEEYKDEDEDMLADAPEDPAKCVDPEEIRFSYVATSAGGDEEATWKEFIDSLSQKLGRKVSLVSYSDVDEQMRAIKNGSLHVAAFGTGDVPRAVNQAGFVPVACFADAEGQYHYTMRIIVPADSPLKKVEDLKGQRMTFVRPNSNSGCTAPLVLLMEKYELLPERDYSWGFSYGHENSLLGVANKKFEAAAVASDLMERQIAAGEIKADDVRTIFESDPYPPGVIGYAHNLAPPLRDGVRQALLDFDWKGTGLEKTFGSSGSVKFAAVSYKDDWAGVRKNNEAGGRILTSLESPEM